MRTAALIAAVAVLATPALAAVDYAEAWHACDAAAVDEGFAEAAIPTKPLAEVGSEVKQFGGAHIGQTLIVLSIPTETGHIYCRTTLDLEVVTYKFNGRTIIDR